MTDQPPPPGNYPPPPPPPGGYPPPPQGNVPPPGAYPTAPQGYPGGYPQVGPARVLPQDGYTSWFTRVLAALIDAVPPVLLTGIAYGIAFATGDTVCVENEYGVGGSCSSSFSGVGAAVLGLAWLASLAYWIWNWGYRQGTTGQSIGKSVMKFKVISEKTWQPIGFGLSLVRQIAHFIDQIICYIGYLFPLWDSKRQTLADKIMTTVCVPVEQSPAQQSYSQQPYTQ
ncbi:RDD family protein [Mycolicibacterium litorale]|uniref:RDD family protein n=1 Tax=Mycolicibacterium litorale TaxID=758802 RepID=UPI0039A2DBC2